MPLRSRKKTSVYTFFMKKQYDVPEVEVVVLSTSGAILAASNENFPIVPTPFSVPGYDMSDL